MTTITRSNSPADLKLIVRKEYGIQIGKAPMLLDRICTKMSTQDAYEVFTSRKGMGVLAEISELGAFPTDTLDQIYRQTVHVKKFGLAAKVSREAIDDNKARNLSAEIGRELRRAEEETKNIKCAALLNNAFSAVAGYTYGDGAALISTAHDPSAVSQANKLAVDTDLQESSLEDMLHLMATTTDLSGRQGGIKARSLIIHPNNKHEAIRILKGTERYSTTDRDLNAMKYLDELQTELIVSPHLTDTDAWFILTDQNDNNNGMIYIERKPFEIESDKEIGVQGFNFYGSCRFQFWVNHWACVFGSAGA